MAGGMPKQGSQVQIHAAELDDQALAQRVDDIRVNRFMYTRAQADAFLAEAARRLRWGRKAESQAENK